MDYGHLEKKCFHAQSIFLHVWKILFVLSMVLHLDAEHSLLKTSQMEATYSEFNKREKMQHISANGNNLKLFYYQFI